MNRNPLLSPHQNEKLWLSLVLFWLSYAVFGWLFARAIPHWSLIFSDKLSLLNLSFSLTYISWAIKLLGIVFIFFMSLSLIAPFDLIALFFGSSLESDKKIFLSFFLWIIIILTFLMWFSLFARLLILFSAGILARLDLQTIGFKKYQCFVILNVLSLTAFLLGLLSFSWLS